MGLISDHLMYPAEVIAKSIKPNYKLKHLFHFSLFSLLVCKLYGSTVRVR